MSESALFSWLLWIVVGAWSGALIAALAFPVVDAWHSQHRIHVSGTALIAALAILISAGFWLDTTARWLSLGSAALGFTLIGLAGVWRERDRGRDE